MAAARKPVVLVKLICFGIVCGFSLAKRKIDVKMILWRTLVIILTLTSTERSFHLLQRGTSEGNAAYAIMAKHLEDFLDLTTGELRFYLQQRALTCHGNHADLAARVLVAFEQNLPIKETAETLLFTKGIL